MTPYLSFSESSLAQNLKRLQNEYASSSDLHWAVALTTPVPISLLENAILPVTRTAACRSISDAEWLAEAGFQKIYLTGRIVNTESLRRTALLAGRVQLVAVIDHFRHAELLSQALHANSQGTNDVVDVLIDIDLGLQSTGIRPGPDTSRLAMATSRLPRLNVAGVFANADFCSVTVDQKKLDEDFIEITQIEIIAEHALLSIPSSLLSTRDIVVGISTASLPPTGFSRASGVVVCPFTGFPGTQGIPGAETIEIQQPIVSLIATVISRPTLEWCVIDAGASHFGDRSVPRILFPNCARILQISNDTSTVQLSGESADLRIGDLVQLASDDLFRFLRAMALSPSTSSLQS